VNLIMCHYLKTTLTGALPLILVVKCPSVVL
jgi:hypothetical protein